MSELLTAESFVESGSRVVKLLGDLDLATAPIAREALADDFDVIDFSELDFLDSSGAQVLVQACHGRTARTVARGLHGQVLRILDLTGLSEMFEIENVEQPGSVSLP